MRFEKSKVKDGTNIVKFKEEATEIRESVNSLVKLITAERFFMSK